MSEDYAEITEMRQAVGDSACPSLFRIVPAKDGGICRVKVPLGQLSAATLRAVAAAAVRFGNGGIDVTNRANFQIRGLPTANEAPLIAALLDTDLAPARPESDDIRNVMVSPTAGIDAGQSLDTRPIASDLLAHLQAAAGYGALSPKFSILVDGSEHVAAVDHPHDVWLASMGGELAIGFAGCPPIAAGDRPAFAALHHDDAVSVVATIIRLFLRQAGGDPKITRIRHLLQRDAGGFFPSLVVEAGAALRRGSDVAAWRRMRPATLHHIGTWTQRQVGLSYVGAVPPLGRVSSEMLEELADIATIHGSGAVRLTPWQSLIVPDVRDAVVAVRALDAAGFICDAQRPLASTIACSGSTGCSAGLADTKGDALAFASNFTGALPGTVHFTGCSKSCACTGAADFTALATAPGTYSLYHKATGGDRFGRCVANDVGIEQIARIIANNTPAQTNVAKDNG